MAERIVLIDGHAHCYQAFYAIKGLTTPAGQPINAVYGFVGILEKVLREHHPEYMAVAFDMPGPTFRHQTYENYKATRKPPPPEFVSQLPIVREVLEAYGIPVVGIPGFEADDVIGTLARQAAERGLEVLLMMTDKDAEQLLGPKISILNHKTGEIKTPESLMEKKGIRPEQVIDLMALSGDTSDNVPGVPRIGEKTALMLIQRYGTLEKVLASADEVPQKMIRENLKKYADLALLSRKLVTIDCNAPVQLDLEACRVRRDESRLRPVFERLGFNQFLSRMGPAPVRTEEREYEVVATPAKLRELVHRLHGGRLFALDVETTGTDPMRAELVGLSFSWEPGKAAYVPVMAPMGEPKMDRREALEILAPLLSDESSPKTGHNIKYDMLVLRNHGVELRGVQFDTMVASYLLDAGRRSHGLDTLALEHLGRQMTPISALIGKGRGQITMDRVPVERVRDYSCDDADTSLRLAEVLRPKLREMGMQQLFEEMELPLISVLADMEYAGIKLDLQVLREMSRVIGENIAALEQEIYSVAGEQFNVNSPKQLSAILFEKLGLPRVKRTKSGLSTDAEVLEELAFQHRLPQLIIEHRQLSKLKSTYVDALPAMVNPRTGKVHASFNQTATATGRLSSSEPNLQNIPIRTEIGSRIREAFIPSLPGNVLLTADYSQIELRMLAHYSEDETLLRAFCADQDIHAFVASQIYGVPLDQVTPLMRRMAKAVNFGIIYGQTAYGLARQLRIGREEAQRFIDAYLAQYPGVRRFTEEVLTQARKQKFVTTICGRRRPLYNLDSSDRNLRSFEERAAVNTVLQGSAADLIKLAMVRIHRRLKELKSEAKMVLQIHDELVFDLPEREVPHVKEMVIEEMSSALKLKAPIRVNVAVGKNWLEAK